MIIIFIGMNNDTQCNRKEGKRKEFIEFSGAVVAQRLCNGLPHSNQGWIPGGKGVKTKLHVLRKGQ